MTISITVQVPPELAHRLRPFRERLPELLERGLRMVALEEGVGHQDKAAIMEILTSNPTPERVMALRPSPKLQDRVSALRHEADLAGVRRAHFERICQAFEQR